MPLPAFVTGILGWLAKLFLGAFASNWQRAKTDAAERKADALKTHAQTLEEARDLEVELIKQNKQIEKEFKEEVKARGSDDPFGTKLWNVES